MHFNLQELIQTHNLEDIEVPFTRKDIDKVIKEMPCDKAPGPDGFNGQFLKKCWHIIKEDIYALCFDFFSGLVDIQAINNSFITLIPKVNNPSTVNDFRPISLINCVVKDHYKITRRQTSVSNHPLGASKSIWFYQNKDHSRLSCMDL
jgi:hypothetical protein